MRRLLAAALIGFGLLAPAAAQEFDDPLGLINFLYAPYLRDEIPDDDRRALFSPGLNDLFDAADARTPEGELGPLDFDPFVNGQDFAITDLVVSEVERDDDIRSTVAVQFDNLGTQQRLVYSLIRRAGGWKIDDVESVAPGFEWRLSEILASDPMLN